MSQEVSILNFVLILLASVIQIHILEDRAWKFLVSVSRLMEASMLISLTVSVTIFICLINFQQIITIRMLPYCIQECMPFTKYVKTSVVASVIFLAARSPLIMLFNLDRSLINMYLAFIFMISVIVLRGENSIRLTFVTLLTSYLSLILALLSLPYITNPNELSTTFIMVTMITFTIFLNLKVFILNAANSRKVVTGLIFRRSETLEALQTQNNSQLDDIAHEGLAGDERDEERSAELEENLNHEILHERENRFQDQEKEELYKGKENVAEVIMDDICSSLEIIEECANFLISKTS